MKSIKKNLKRLAPEDEQNEDVPIKKHKENLEKNKGNTPMKISKKELFKPPTVEELNQLRETEILFNSNLFRLQSEELLKEVFVKLKRRKAAADWIEKFRKFTRNLPEFTDNKLADFNCVLENEEKVKLKGILKEISNNIPIVLKTDQNSPVKFLKPISIEIFGLFNINAVVGPVLNFNLNIVMPRSCFQSKDYLNGRYLVKRALYLSYIATHLKQEDLCSKLCYSYLNGNNLVPILEIVPKTLTNVIFKVLFTPEQSTFKLQRFEFDKNNVRPIFFNMFQNDCTVSEDEIKCCTPFYNSVILQDLILKTNDDLNKSKLIDMKGVSEGLILLIIWLRQRELLDHFGGFTEDLLYSLLSYLVQIGKINKHMSSYQVIRNVWNYLSTSTWDISGISLNNDKTTLNKFHDHFSVVFVDYSGFYNLANSVDLNIYLKIKNEASLALKYLDEGKMNSFQDLFTTKMKFYLQFDAIINIHDSTALDNIYNNLEDKFKMGYLSYKYPLIKNHILNLVKTGLTDRITFIVPKFKPNITWEIGEQPNESLSVCFGIQLNTSSMYQIVDKGPETYDPLAKKFRDFWGDKSELRRFKDGSISEAVYWPAKTINEKRRLSKNIIEFVLKEKLKIEQFNVVYDQFETILQICKTSAIEEGNLNAVKIFDELAKRIRDLNLPLSISNIQGISEDFCHSNPFPPVSRNYFYLQVHAKKTDNILTFKDDVELKYCPYFVKPISGVIQMVQHSKWPNDLEAIRNLRTAFYLQICKQLLKIDENLHLVTNITKDYFDVLYRGLVFRFNIFHQKEIILLKKQQDARGIISYKDTPETIRLEKEYYIKPKIIGALNGIHSRCPSFGPGSVLIKRWLNSQLLDQFYVPSIVISLLVASLYTDSAPFSWPCLPQVTFLRFLSLLVNFTFSAQPLIINFNDEITKEQRNELESKFQQNRNEYPPLCIITPFDFKSSLTENAPTKEILHRMIILAKECLNTIEKNIYSESIFNIMALFKPNLQGYNVIIYLEQNLNSRIHESLSTVNEQKKAYSEFKENVENKLPIVNFNPVDLYLEELRKNYSKFALFFHDNYGGNFIAVLWKPNINQKLDFKICNMEGAKLLQKEEKLQVNIDAITEDFFILGNGLVNTIEVL